MNFDETSAGRDEDEPEAESHDPIAGLLEVAGDPPRRGFETQRRKAMIAAALFDEPLTPVKIGRFTIVRELGAGGMGVVYVAYDEQLDRRVAVKLLRSADTDTQGRARLEREAQAMARLSHPNVVAVHEVGTHRDQVFVAMEFVEGGDLRAWLADERRDWRAVVEVFRQAGEGLAAAHEAGLVHRDFKPDNVLVGHDGRARVADFGLAHAHEPSAEPPATSSTSSTSKLDSALTKTGALMGTPAYMAPEQYAGKPTDARTDQFAFCVALWEGVYGQRPFSGRNLLALSSAIAGKMVDEPPAEADVPAWLRVALLRGLSPKPDERWPSMRALLEVLANDPQARRRRRTRIIALASAVGLALAGLGYVSATALRESARRRYWSALTEQLLDIERVRGVRQANDDALRARDATRMSVYRRYRPRGGIVDHEDPTIAAALLREVEGDARLGQEWISAANEILGQPLSYAVLEGHRDVVTALVFAPDEPRLYSAGADAEVWRWDIPSGRGERIIAHDDDAKVTALALDPEGRLLVSVAHDGTARAWSSERGARVIAELGAELTDVAFSPDGRRIVVAARDRTATILELETGARVVLRGHGNVVYSALFDATGERVLTTSADKTARIWRAADGQLLTTLAGHEASVFFARFVDPATVVTGSDDGSVRAWTLDGDAVLDSRTLVRHAADISAFAVHGRTIAAASLDGRVSITSLDDPTEARTLAAHAKAVWALCFTPDGERLLSTSFDTTAQLHDVHGRAPTTSFVGHRLALLSAAVDPRGRWLATGAWDGSVRVWDLSREPLALTLEGHAGTVGAAQFDHTGQRLVTASHDGRAIVWDAASGRRITTLTGDHDALNAIAIAPDGRRVAAAPQADAVELWDLTDGTHRSLLGHTRSTTFVDFDASGQRLGSASVDRSARVWSVEGEQLLVLTGHEARVTAIDLGTAEQPIATASLDGTLRLWDPSDGHPLAVLRGHEGGVVALARAPSGLIATASDDTTARLWPAHDPDASLILAGHSKPLWSVAFDRSGTRLVSSSHDGTARVWDARDGRLLATLTGHSETVWGAEFLDPEHVVTVANDRTLRIWSIADATPTIVLSGHDDAIMDVAVSPTLELVATASVDRAAKLWRISQLSSSATELGQALARASIVCLDPEQRMRELGETQAEARAAFARCTTPAMIP